MDTTNTITEIEDNSLSVPVSIPVDYVLTAVIFFFLGAWLAHSLTKGGINSVQFNSRI